MMKWHMILYFLLKIYPIYSWNFNFDSLMQKTFEMFDNAVLFERCNSGSIQLDFNQLDNDITHNLFGQPFVNAKLLPLLKNHFLYEPKKPLVISMHGWTGGGKNYVVSMIIKSIYRLQYESKFVHQFCGRLHFPLNSKNHVDQYKIDLQNWVKGNVSICPRSVFIFDEIDKMPGDLLESIKPYFDYHGSIDSINFRESIFIFLTNLGANLINQKYMELWLSGIPREKMPYRSFESSIRKLIYNSEGAFQKSSVLEDHLVSLYLPFLPLERNHVRLCIVAEMKRQGIYMTSDKIESVLNEMEFYDDKFSSFGCKRVHDLVAMLDVDVNTEL